MLVAGCGSRGEHNESGNFLLHILCHSLLHIKCSLSIDYHVQFSQIHIADIAVRSYIINARSLATFISTHSNAPFYRRLVHSLYFLSV